jgi:hypothetical protein
MFALAESPRRVVLLCVIGLLTIPISGSIAYFFTGAAIFPVVNTQAAFRVVVSLGLMAIVYGVECVVKAGRIEMCGFLSGNCIEHDLSTYAQVVWFVLVFGVAVTVVHFLRRSARDSTQPASPDE